MDRLKNFDEKIAGAISRVKNLKEEKLILEQRIKDLEAQLDEKNREIQKISSEKTAVRDQITELLKELETVDIG